MNQFDLPHDAINAYKKDRLEKGNPIENEVSQFGVRTDRESVLILSGPNDRSLRPPQFMKTGGLKRYRQMTDPPPGDNDNR